MELNHDMLIAIRDAATRKAFYSDHQAPHWFHRGFCDLAHAADILAAYIEREVHGGSQIHEIKDTAWWEKYHAHVADFD